MAGNDEFAKKLRERFKDLEFNASGLLNTQFEEEPVPLNVFVEDSGYLGQLPLSDIQYDTVRHIERVYFDGWEQDDDGLWTYDPTKDLYAAMGAEFDPYWAEPYRMVNYVTVMWGKGSGKDMVSGISALRIAYLLMCMKSPQIYFGMPDSASIHMLNVAATAQQAGRAYFKPIRSIVRKGWFADRCNPMVNAIEFEKGIEAISGNSETESQEGLNLILGVADETDAFKSREQARASGKREAANTLEGILDMMESSGLSRFPTFKNVRISYPRHFGSPIMQLMSRGKKSIAKDGDRSPHYISGPYATWDVHPLKRKINFASKYEDDAVEAAAKYECRPQKASTPYFRNIILTQEAFIPREHPPLIVTGYRRDGSSWMPEYHFAKDFYPIRGAIYAMHGDLAVNGDKAGIAMAHTVRRIEFEGDADDEEQGPNPITEVRPLIQVDFAISFEANLGSTPPREIQLRWARQLAMELVRRGFKVHRYSFDGFQSLDNMQILESKGIEALKISTDRTIEPYKTLRDLMYEGRVMIPEDEKLLNEILSLNVAFGKIDHPTHGSKDVADAVACAVYNAVDLGGEEDLTGERDYYSSGTFEVGRIEGTELPIGLSLEALGLGEDVWSEESLYAERYERDAFGA